MTNMVKRQRNDWDDDDNDAGAAYPDDVGHDMESERLMEIAFDIMLGKRQWGVTEQR